MSGAGRPPLCPSSWLDARRGAGRVPYPCEGGGVHALAREPGAVPPDSGPSANRPSDGEPPEGESGVRGWRADEAHLALLGTRHASRFTFQSNNTLEHRPWDSLPTTL